MTAAPELHHPVLVAGLPAAGSDVTVRADAAQRAAIADRLRIPAVARLVCRYHLVPGQDGMVMARGVLEAEVTQVCVVSLDPFDSVLRDEFRLRFVPLRGEDDAPELLDDPESDDEIVYEGRLIDASLGPNCRACRRMTLLVLSARWPGCAARTDTVRRVFRWVA